MKTIDNIKAYICESFAVGIWNANNRTYRLELLARRYKIVSKWFL